MKILVLSACGLVANEYMRLKSKTVVIGASGTSEETIEAVNASEVDLNEDINHKGKEQQQQPPGDVTADMVPARYHCTTSSPAPISLGVRTLKTDNTADIGYEEA